MYMHTNIYTYVLAHFFAKFSDFIISLINKKIAKKGKQKIKVHVTTYTYILYIIYMYICMSVFLCVHIHTIHNIHTCTSTTAKRFAFPNVEFVSMEK